MAAEKLAPRGELALSYASHGVRVVPCYWITEAGVCSCYRGAACGKNAGKHPTGKLGSREGTTDARQIAAWWQATPLANIGLVLGEGFVSLDIDVHKGDGFAELAALEAVHGALPRTVRWRSGSGGGAALFRHDGEIRNSAKVFGDNIDVRGVNGISIAPGSSNTKGPYVFEPGCSFGEVEIAELPAWVAERIARLANVRSLPSASPSGAPAADHVIEGGRNDFLFRYACGLQRRGHTPGEIHDMLVVRNAHRCRPPLEADELRDIATKATRYEGGPADLSTGASATGEVRGVDVATGDTRLFERGDQAEMAHALLAVLAERALTFDLDDVWSYDAEAHVWRVVPREALEDIVYGFRGRWVAASKDKVKPLLLSHGAMRGAATIARNSLARREGRALFEAARRGVAFTNGLLTLGADKRLAFEPHDAEHMTRHVHPFAWDAGARCPMFEEFLYTLFSDCGEDERADRIACLQEFLGACLFGLATSYQKALVAIGAGNNGKSQMLNIARALFPEGAVSSVPPSAWGVRFRLSGLVGKLANFVDETPTHDITAGDQFKSVITGDELETEYKGKDAFKFRPRAGHIFSANQLPATNDQSEGFFRRVLFVRFDVDMASVAGARPDIGRDIVAAELPGIVAWAARGAERRANQETYTESEGGRALHAEWRTESDPVRMFFAQYAWPPTDPAAGQLYDQFREWATGQGFSSAQVPSNVLFARRVLAGKLAERYEARTGRFYRRIAK